MNEQVPINDVVFREDLYPRIKRSPETVQKYAEDLSVLPPIELNQHRELIDGWHRWTAHIKLEAESIPAIITETRSDEHLLELAIERNATFGLQLSQADKQAMARRIYHVTHTKDRAEKKKTLAKILSVSDRTVQSWLSRIDKDAKAERDARIRQLWLECYTQQEIAKRVDLDPTDKALRVSGKLADLPENQKPAADHLTDFTPPIYNVWKRQKKSEGSSHFGNSEAQWVDNLLYLYTKPLEIVVDPFAGGGSTLDVCMKRWRRCWIGDRKPIPERAHEIREHDLVADGLPNLKGRWKDVSLIYLDPPYWKQAEGRYSHAATDLANMPLGQFRESLNGIVNGFAKKMSAGSHIALIIQPTQWKAPERKYTDHVADLIRDIRLPLAMRVQAPYESQQCTAQMAEWAKEHRQVLVLSREIIIWEVV